MVDEVRTGTPGDDLITTGDGNDTITGLGGSDTIESGAGDDFINPGDAGEGGFEAITPGPGNDEVDFSDLTEAYVELRHFDLDAGISVAIDRAAGTGVVDKGTNGTTTITAVNNPILAGNVAGGLAIFGTGFDDSFAATGGTSGFLQFTGAAGNDTFNMTETDTSGTYIRINYAFQGASTGINADLTLGTVSDGLGGTDTITGPWTGDLRGTMLADTISGSDANERFILMAGNDTLDGGGGIDLVRYDRSRVEAVTVDLAAGTATGTWRDETFSHSLLNVENVRGSRDGDDTLIGDSGANRLEGRGGNDTLLGGGGDDQLEGGAGNDVLNASGGPSTFSTLDAGPGNDEIDFGDVTGGSHAVAHFSLDAGVSIVIDALAMTGSVDKGANGTTTLTDLGTVISNGRLLAWGTAFDDSINVTGPADGSISIRGYAGNDTITYTGGAGNAQLNYGTRSVSSGITADLSTGIVANDGFGSSDTLLGDPIGSIVGTRLGDVITGSNAGEEIRGEGGNDTLSGGAGEDQIFGGAGDDLITPGDAAGGGVKRISAGTGNDVIDFAGLSEAYVELRHEDLDAGITVTLDLSDGTSTIDKGANGTTTLRAASNPIEAGNVAGGLAVFGTFSDDVFNIAEGRGGFMQLSGWGGNDAFNLAGSGVRLDYAFQGASVGITADFSTGTVSEDGFGGTDTITGTWRVDLRATMMDDRIVGSDRDDRFILMAGNDTLDGGAGIDLVRYDRTRVEAVEVDLAAGTATGTWRGETFTHSLSNVENVRGSRDGDDTLRGNDAANVLEGRGGDDVLDGRGGFDTARIGVAFDAATITQEGDTIRVVSSDGTDTLSNIEELSFTDRSVLVEDLFPSGPITGTPGDDVLAGTDGADTINALAGNDTLRGLGGDDSLNAGDGTDTINGGDGNDTITGGETTADRRDTIFGGGGNDNINAGHGNDLVYGQDGNDVIAGGFGADELFGQNGDDVITGSAFSDLVFGGDGDDFVNGGFGFDRINGGTGADRFFHAAAEGHGSDWLQDYSAAEGDVLLFGGGAASASDFVVRFAHTATPAGERSGDDDVQEAFVNFRGQTLWALVDGGGQDQINLQIGTDVFDLLA